MMKARVKEIVDNNAMFSLIGLPNLMRTIKAGMKISLVVEIAKPMENARIIQNLWSINFFKRANL